MFSTKSYVVIYFLILYSVNGEKPYNYHERFGIKRAEEIRNAETLMLGRTSKIIGGTQVPENSHIYYQAGIVITLLTGWTSVCGGSLVSNTRVLTAAHCWYDGRNQARQFTIVLGSTRLFNGGKRIVTTDVVMHPSWNTVEFTHDIAMVAIPRVQFTNNILPVVLPTLANMNQNFAGMSGVVSGYGKTSDAQSTVPPTTSLYQTTVKIMTNTECQKSYDFNIHVGHLCTSGVGVVGTCDGDSGGPLTVVYNNARTLVGIVSFGLGDACQSTYPSVYTRVTAFISWIEANL
ncbi:hypothetical protein O0L34_g15497 [Tuta absoluta]|nr:hypothetical protein O0L34_g15497 [Tuta absoluta]